MPCRRLDSEDAVPPFYDIQIKLHYSFFIKGFLESPCYNSLGDFSDRIFRWRQVKILGKLLSYRACAKTELFFIKVFLESFFHSGQVETVMCPEFPILSGNCGVNNILRNSRKRDPFLIYFLLFTFFLPLPFTVFHERSFFRIVLL